MSHLGSQSCKLLFLTKRNLKKKSYQVSMLRFRQQHWWPAQFSRGWPESRWTERRPGNFPQPIRQTVTSMHTTALHSSNLDRNCWSTLIPGYPAVATGHGWVKFRLEPGRLPQHQLSAAVLPSAASPRPPSWNEQFHPSSPRGPPPTATVTGERNILKRCKKYFERTGLPLFLKIFFTYWKKFVYTQIKNLGAYKPK